MGHRTVTKRILVYFYFENWTRKNAETPAHTGDGRLAKGGSRAGACAFARVRVRVLARAACVRVHGGGGGGW